MAALDVLPLRPLAAAVRAVVEGEAQRLLVLTDAERAPVVRVQPPK